MAKKRITITVPEDLVDAADERAKALGRSRGWVLVEALRAYLARPPGALLREALSQYAAGPGPGRLAQLKADLALTPEERVASAEETALASELIHPRPRRSQVVVFESIEAFHAWEKREAIP